MQQIVGIYGKHYTDDEIKGLLQFFSSPLGRKFAAESPRIEKEIMAVQGTTVTNAARDSLQSLRAQNPEFEKLVPVESHSKPETAVTLQDQMRQISQRP
jgi:hypothetical protein